MKSWLAALLLTLSAPALADAIDLTKAKAYFAERQALCDADQGRLWNKPLCGPMIFVDDASHEAVANEAGPGGALTARDGLFVGKLPLTQTVANTAFDWDGTRWSMVEWPLPEEKKERGALLIHESWHRIQDEIGLPMRAAVADHLGTAFGRITLRLEWRALAAALTASDEAARKAAIRDAFTFRQWRRAAARPTGEIENQLELNEGLAEYTGRKLSGQDAAAIAAALGRADHKSSFVRSFAYVSGPAYGYLLDLSAPDWRRHLTSKSDLGAILLKASGVPSEPAKPPPAAGKRYGYEEIAAEEHEAEHRRAEQARHWTDLLVRGPTLRLPLVKMQVRFDPNTVFPLPPQGTVYPTLEIIDDWGSFKATAGALIEKGWSAAVLPASAQSAVTVKPGWSWHPGKRKGDLILAKD